MNLVMNGASEYVIVHSKHASLSEMTAARELQRYLEKISGAKLPVAADDAPAAEKEIVVGKTNREAQGDFDRKELGEDGFIIKTSGTKLWLVGGEKRGTLYSVYTFLEEYLGCRFYLQDFEKIPQMSTISLDEIREDKQVPVFEFRDVGWHDYIETDISVKRKINFNTWDRALPKEVGGGVSYAKEEGGHTFFRFVNPDEYFESHPEYFSLNKEGKRVRDAQLCLTNPDVYKIVLQGVRRWLTEDPDAKIISISQNDTRGACLCENCIKVYEEEGGAYSGTLLRFINAIAEDIAEDFPNVWVDTYAYQYTRNAPAKTKPAKNVHIRLCTINNCASHPIDHGCAESPDKNYYGQTNTFMKDLDDWSKICDHIFIYDYTCNYQHWVMTFPDFAKFKYNCRFFADHHTIGIMAQGNHQSKSAELGELRSYLIAKLLWDPYMSDEEYYAHMDDFLEGVYGPGGKYIRAYIDLAEELTKNICYNLSTDPNDMYPLLEEVNHAEDELPEDLSAEMMRQYETEDWTKYWNWYVNVVENPITAQGEKLFKQAMALAETDFQREQVDKIYCQVEYIKSYYYKKKMDVGLEALGKLLKRYIRIHPGAFAEEERAQLPEIIVKYVRDKALTEYAQYNKALWRKLLSKGITHLYEGLLLAESATFDFSKEPVDWFERYWLNL